MYDSSAACDYSMVFVFVRRSRMAGELGIAPRQSVGASGAAIAGAQE